MEVIQLIEMVLGFIFGQLGLFLVTWFCLVLIYLFCQYLNAKFGPRVQIDGRRTILVTGATSGFGLSVAKHLYKLGFSLVATYYNQLETGYGELKSLLDREEEERTRQVGGTSGAPQPRLFLVKMDVRDKQSISECASQVRELLKRHNLELFRVINNAGVSTDGPFEWSREVALSNVIETNLLGPMRVSRAFMSDIIQARGRIINVSSGLQVVPCATVSAYGASKSGLAYFSAALHQDIRRYGASCVCIFPGNLITSTNIIYTRMKCAQDSLNELTDLEKKLYQKSIAQYGKFLNRQIQAQLKFSGNDADEVATTYGIDCKQEVCSKQQGSEIELPEEPRKSKKSGRKSITSQLSRWLSLRALRISGGVGGSVPVEQSGILSAFERAVLLERPPTRLYAGNAAYTNLYGPLTDFIPSVIFLKASNFTTKLFD